MAYTKQTWNTGDTITADKLNHMEDGIASGGSSGGAAMIVQTTGETGEGFYSFTMQNTWQEIYNALVNGTSVFVNIPFDETNQYFAITGYYEYGLYVSIIDNGAFATFNTNAPSGYAVWQTTPPEG